jgi:hypothetical protein
MQNCIIFLIERVLEEEEEEEEDYHMTNKDGNKYKSGYKLQVEV